MVNLCKGSVKYWAIMDSRDLCSLPTSATSRSATSFWNVSVSGTRPYDQALPLSDILESHLDINGVEILKGKFPMIWICGISSFQSLLRSSGNILLISKDKTSPQWQSIIPGHASSKIFSVFSKRLSFSMRITFLGLFCKMDLVMLPGPGPTSHTAQSLTFPAAFTILLVNFSSKRKFWERCFIALSWYNLTRSRTEGRGGKRCWRSFWNILAVGVAILFKLRKCIKLWTGDLKWTSFSKLQL